MNIKSTYLPGQIFFHSSYNVFYQVEKVDYIDKTVKNSRSKVKNGTDIQDWMYTCKLLNDKEGLRPYSSFYQERIGQELEIVPILTTDNE